MKKLSVILFLTIFGLFIFGNFTIGRSYQQQDTSMKNDSLPADVASVVKQKCFGCHNSNSRNDKAKDKLCFDQWNEFDALKKIGKIKDINKELTEGKMPPEKFLEMFPNRKLTDAESKTLIDWTNKELQE